jgi:aconitate hydratase
MLLGVRAVIAENFERIHRSNLIGMGVLPLQFQERETADTLGLQGTERFTVSGLAGVTTADAVPDELTVRAEGEDGHVVDFTVTLRIDTPKEAEYYRHGGILHYVLRNLAGSTTGAA